MTTETDNPTATFVWDGDGKLQITGRADIITAAFAAARGLTRQLFDIFEDDWVRDKLEAALSTPLSALAQHDEDGCVKLTSDGDNLTYAALLLSYVAQQDAEACQMVVRTID